MKSFTHQIYIMIMPKSEVWFAGNGYGNNDGELSFFYQKLNLVNPGVHIYGNMGGGTVAQPAFGKLYPWYQHGILDVAKIMPTDNVDEAGVASNFYECNYYPSIPSYPSYSFPMLNRVNYSDAFLDDFATPFFQSTTIYTYPRVAGNTSLGNFFPFLDFNNKHFPNHTAHQRYLSGYGEENYVMGATTQDPISPVTGVEYMALDATTIFGYNPCNYETESLTADYIEAGLYVPPITPTSSVLNIYYPSLSTTDISDIEINECDGMYEFKTAGINTTSLELLNSESNFVLKCSDKAVTYKVYNTLGAIVLKGHIGNGYAFGEMNSFASGVYLVEVLNGQNQRIGINKFVK